MVESALVVEKTMKNGRPAARCLAVRAAGGVG
jgi:hypothetical protein